MLRWIPLGMVLVVGCASTSGTRLEVAMDRPALQVRGAARPVTVYTDLDRIYDVDAAGEYVYVASDHGLLVYSGEQSHPVRLAREHGLPSDVVTAVAAKAGGGAILATPSGLALIHGAQLVGDPPPAPAIGDIVDFVVGDDGLLWACGMWGVARLQPETGWESFGEPTSCTRIVSGPEGSLWIGTTRGLWRVEGDVVREHAPGRGIPADYVLDIAPIGDGKTFALVQGPSDMYIAYFDGVRWFGYSIRDFEHRLVGMASRGGEVLLFTEGHVLAVFSADRGEGAPLTPLMASEAGGVRSYRASIAPILTFVGPERPPQEEVDVWRDAVRLAPVPERPATIAAPAFEVAVRRSGPTQPHLVRTSETAIFVADQNRGVARMDQPERWFRTRELVSADLQIAGARGTTWTVTESGAVARLEGDRWLRIGMPDEVLPQAIADGPGGVYLLAQVANSPNTVRVYRHDGQSWSRMLERTLEVEGNLAGVPFIGVDSHGHVWAALEVPHGDRTTVRGVAVLDPDREDVLYHHRGANGADTYRLQDEVTSIDLGQDGMAWFASFHGAIRLGNHQAVIFNEARGVRGEIVTDVLVESAERVWVAAAEGVGFYQNQRFDFRMPSEVQDVRVQALALDSQGDLWGAGVNGVVVYDGEQWTRVALENDLITNALLDIEVDAENRVWLAAEAELLMVEPPTASPM